MRANKGKDTGPELEVRRLLREAGFAGYRLHWPIKAADGRTIVKPDICYPGRKLAIFVHGCFWHRCPHCAPPIPKANRDYWLAKFEDNVARDQIKKRQLEFHGWMATTIWECKLEKGVIATLNSLAEP
jgi:DNA mismatch endonuclease (patch repair protein)